MSYYEAMDYVSRGGHVRRPEMGKFDVYIRMEGEFIVRSTNEGYAASHYKPTEEDKLATDWEKI